MQKRDFFKCNDYFTHLRKHCQLKYVCKPFQLLKGPPVILYFFSATLSCSWRIGALSCFWRWDRRQLLTPIGGRRCSHQSLAAVEEGEQRGRVVGPEGANHGGSSCARSCSTPVTCLRPTTSHGSHHGLTSPCQPWRHCARTSRRRP
jgi:hypothetical protein